MNPENEDEICCIIKGFFVEICTWSLSELANRFNAHGERVQGDDEYRPIRAFDLLGILNKRR